MKWWSENWESVAIAVLIVALVVASAVWPDATLGCSVSVKSTQN